MSSQRPKKLKGSKSITLPPELAAHYLRNAVNSSSNSKDDAEMKALMSMFVEIMGMSPDETTATSKGVSFSFTRGGPSSTTNGNNTSSSSSSQWPPTAAAAAAAAASGMFSSDGQWSFDYYNDEDEEEEELVEALVSDSAKKQAAPSLDTFSNKPSAASSNNNEEEEEDAAAEAMARQIAQDELAAEQERAKKAAKRREKKQRRKNKQKQEALQKAQEAQLVKKQRQVQSWKSRVVDAASNNEDYKIQALLAESPLSKLEQDDTIEAHLEYLLPHCIATSKRNEGDSACQKLAAFVVNMSVSVAFTIGKNGRSALHSACFVGDAYFVKLVTDKSEKESPLDLPCKDSGWTPLHYAVVAGCQEAMEELLIVNVNVQTRTDESLTCKSSNGEGITALELAEILASGRQHDEIETQGAALEEALQRYASNKGEKKRWTRILKSMAERLRDVEENGYEPPPPPQPQVSESDGKQRSVSVVSSSSEDAKKKSKKKKKKQLKREQSGVSAASSSVPSETTSARSEVPVVEKKVDPLVTALLGMGFTEEQIRAAAKACGGMERATADEMVMWILGGGEDSSSDQPAAQADSEAAPSPSEPSWSNSKQAPAKKSSQKSAVNLKRAQKENMEAVMREEEARAIADRLAAKREEQRRRNREWNNRAQARQKEEMELKAQEEARRIANDRAAAQRQAAVAAGQANAMPPPQTRAPQANAPTQILQRPSHMPVGGLQAGMMPVRPYPSGAPANAGAAQGYGEYEGMAQYVSSANSVSSAGSGRNAGVAAQYVSSGNSVSSAGSGMNAMAAQYVSSANSVSSGGSGMYHQGHQPMYGYPNSSVPPPGFHPFGGTPVASAGSTSLSMSEETPVSYEESGSGEIRATARSFVPTGFKPTPVSNGGSASASSSAPAPPTGMGLAGTTTEPSQSAPAPSNDDPLASLLSAAAPGTAPPGTGAPSPALEPTVEETSLSAVMGFDLNGSSNGSSLLDSLSMPPPTTDEPTGSSIWGGTSSLASGPSSLAGFTADAAASKTEGVGDGSSSMWNSGMNQGGTSRLGSIW